MKLTDIIKEVLSGSTNIIKHGWLNEKILLETKMTCSLYNHIQVINNSYDDITEVIWTDIKGMDYGWRWLRYPEEKRHDMMHQMVIEECNNLKNVINDTYYIVNDENGVKNYTFITVLENKYRWDTLISFSNSELCY